MSSIIIATVPVHGHVPPLFAVARHLVEALADDNVLIVVSTGGRQLDTLPPLPANAGARFRSTC